jgi:hypothetical protein
MSVSKATHHIITRRSALVALVSASTITVSVTVSFTRSPHPLSPTASQAR